MGRRLLRRAATYAVPQFRFSYTAKNQGLLTGDKHWINADTGNSGDIATG
jgi:hypothetical protein